MVMRLGESLSLVIFGESHATGVGVLIEGLPPGIPIDKSGRIAGQKGRRVEG